jgi:hypothetical protein
MRTQDDLTQELNILKDKLDRTNTRLKDPTASEATIRDLLKNKNEFIADIQTLEIELSKFPPVAKSFERILNESEEQYGNK